MKTFFKNKIILTALSIFGFSILFFIVVFLLLHSKKSEIERVLSGVEGQASDSERAGLIKRITEENKDKILFLNNSFIEPGKEVAIIESTEKIARASLVNASISSVSDESERGSQAKSLSIKVKFTGKWSSVVNFIQNIEKMQYVTNIKDFSLIGNPVSGLWTGEIEFSTFKADQSKS